MPGDRHGIPSEGGELVAEGIKGIRVLGAGTLLEAVAVHDEDEIRQAPVTREHRRLPVAPLLQFAVPDNDEGPAARPR
ncbi:unannotated protein [freshwater metagenome]|uniref:Unannotated protein n=1 Tax=freshwater metagenome TaxID=449393 RepID=A0A6J7HKI5_9ZZZZ